MPKRLLLLLLPLGSAALLWADALDDGEKAARDWINLRLETTRIESEWASQRPLLTSMVDGMKERATTLEEKRDGLDARTAKDRDDNATLAAKNSEATDMLAKCSDRLVELTTQLMAMRPSLPPRLSEALELPYKSLGNSKLAPGERMQLIVTVLNRCAQFNRTVTGGSEILSLGTGEDARSLEVLYWGLSHGYALDRAAGKVWYGAPGADGWRWQPKADALAGVEHLMAVYDDKADPAFVSVPATVNATSVQTQTK
ncbi:MAG TPA: DUF3450 family protein [Opitutaceae bacterium]|jgi:hypothetical protein